MKPHCYTVLILMLWTISALGQGTETTPQFYLGADLSYVNEMEDCGAVYRVEGEPHDPYQIFSDYGANLVRLRLWHTPAWTEYSTFDDVVRSLERATAWGMDVLLDFHYSDTWADPSKQTIPAAWEDLDDPEVLGQALYQYTYGTLMALDDLGLMPEMVQVGNEINSEILRPEGAPGYPINWERNALLLNNAIRAVRDADEQSSESPRVMLHVAKPEEVEGWLLAATRAGVTDFDMIGISYYPGWSTHSIKTVGNVIRLLRHKFNTEVMIVETAYPWTFDSVNESAGNILNPDFLVDDYPASPDGQRQFLIDLAQTVFASGGLGIVYWEPAWVSTSCRTLWGQGSHWENATFFDFHNDNVAHSGVEFLQYAYDYPMEVTLRFSFESKADQPEEIFFWGDFTGLGRRMLSLSLSNGEYTLKTRLMPGTQIHYQFYSSAPASPQTALLPQDCTEEDGYVTIAIDASNVTITQTDNSCPLLSD